MRKLSSHHVTIASLLLSKEKWLDEEPEKISVLKYVATFKIGCLGQGKWLKEIFRSQKSKMKVRFDR